MELPVDSSLWSGIQAGISQGAVGSTAAVASKGMSLFAKLGITALVAGAAITTVLVVRPDSPNEQAVNANGTKQSKVEANTSVDAKAQGEFIQEGKEEKSVTTPYKTRVSGNHGDSHSVSTLIVDAGEELSASVSEVKEQVAKTTLEQEPVKPNHGEAQPTHSGNNVVQEQGLLPELPVAAKVEGSVESWNDVNVFSPNNDGVNDYFFLRTNNLKSFVITIMDRNGKVVFQSEDKEFRWDGMHYLSGDAVPPGDYVYMIYAVDLTGEEVKLVKPLKIFK